MIRVDFKVTAIFNNVVTTKIKGTLDSDFDNET